MVLGSALVHRDSREWRLPRSTRFAILTAVAIGCLAGCAVPAFFAGGYVGFVAWTAPVTPKTILGGLLFGFLAAAVVKRAMGVPYDTSDAFARGGCLMMAIGRLGCVAQHCCFGRPTTSSLGVDLGDGILRVPVQAIEATLMVLFFAVLSLLHHRRRFDHRRLFLLFAGYGALRFGLEFLREDIASRWLGLGFYQWLAAGLFAVGVYQIAIRTRKIRTGNYQRERGLAIEPSQAVA